MKILTRFLFRKKVYPNKNFVLFYLVKNGCTNGLKVNVRVTIKNEKNILLQWKYQLS